MAQIGRKTILTSVDMISRLLIAHEDEIDEAYLGTENALTVSLNLAYSANPKGKGIDIKAGIKFTKEQVKDSLEGSFDEAAETLFDNVTVKPHHLDPDKKMEKEEVVETPAVTNSAVNTDILYCWECYPAPPGSKPHVAGMGVCGVCGAAPKELVRIVF